MLNQFFLINFPQGAAGKFICSVLMASPSVAHFDCNIESNKTIESCLAYVKACFTRDFKNWIGTEPSHGHAWNLHFLSSKYPRGNDLSKTEFINQCWIHGTDHFKNMLRQGMYILFPWHKIYIPEFFIDSNKLTILLDEESHNWFDQSLWLKHYNVQNDKVVLLIHSWKQNKAMKTYFDQYKNPMYSDEPVETFYQTHIVNNPDKKLFDVEGRFADRKNNFCTSLSKILDVTKFVECIEEIENKFNLKAVDRKFLVEAHQHWRSLHHY